MLTTKGPGTAPMWLLMLVNVSGKRIDSDGGLINQRLEEGHVYLVPAGMAHDLVGSGRAKICEKPEPVQNDQKEPFAEESTSHPLVGSTKKSGHR